MMLIPVKNKFLKFNEKKVELIIVEQSVVKDVKIYFIGLKNESSIVTQL